MLEGALCFHPKHLDGENLAREVPFMVLTRRGLIFYNRPTWMDANGGR